MTEALYFHLVISCCKPLALGKRDNKALQGMLINRCNFPAAQTCQVMVVFSKIVTQLYFIFPANVDTPNDTHFFKKCNCPVDTGPVNPIPGQGNKLIHRKRFLASEQLKNSLPLAGNAFAVRP
jgi:hypothetical protein